MDYLTKLRTGMRTYLDETKVLFQVDDKNPVPDSLAAIELSSSARAESIVSAMTITNILIETVGEHVSAFLKMITDPVEIIACWTCVRSMLESASLAAWLVDPTIDARARVSRVFALRYEGMEKELTFGRCMKLDPSEIGRLERRIEDVERLALSLGYPRVENRKGQRIGIGESMPSATDIIDHMLDEGMMYRLLSAVAHGHQWAIRGLCYQEVDGPPGQCDISGVPTSVFEKSWNLEGITLLAVTAMRALGVPTWNWCRYVGWDQANFVAIFEAAFDRLHARDAIRFWR